MHSLWHNDVYKAFPFPITFPKTKLWQQKQQWDKYNDSILCSRCYVNTVVCVHYLI